jgi:hypothetical protein
MSGSLAAEAAPGRQEAHGVSFEATILPQVWHKDTIVLMYPYASLSLWQIRRVALHTMLAGRAVLEGAAVPDGAPCVAFQLWGLDFMVDEGMAVQLLEANVSPAWRAPRGGALPFFRTPAPAPAARP